MNNEYLNNLATFICECDAIDIVNIMKIYITWKMPYLMVMRYPIKIFCFPNRTFNNTSSI